MIIWIEYYFIVSRASMNCALHASRSLLHSLRHAWCNEFYEQWSTLTVEMVLPQENTLFQTSLKQLLNCAYNLLTWVRCCYKYHHMSQRMPRNSAVRQWNSTNHSTHTRAYHMHQKQHTPWTSQQSSHMHTSTTQCSLYSAATPPPSPSPRMCLRPFCLAVCNTLAAIITALRTAKFSNSM